MVPSVLRQLRAGHACFILMLCGAGSANAEALHFTVNMRGDYAGAMEVGFNLADVNTLDTLMALPQGMKGVMWLGNGYNTSCSWRLNDAEVAQAVMAIRDQPKFSGIYYISDEPHPARCPDAASQLTARSALIRSLDPRAKTFILVLNGAQDPTEFAKLKDAADYIGLDPYPCNRNNEQRGCDLSTLRKRIEQARTAGIAVNRIVPVFQAFGQSCTTQNPPYYRLPSAAETNAMLEVWDELVPPAERPFDMTYSWGVQPRVACPTLATARGPSQPDLRSTFANYFKRKANAQTAE
jgi:hypothetical protein